MTNYGRVYPSLISIFSYFQSNRNLDRVVLQFGTSMEREIKGRVTSMLTAEDVVWRIAAECSYIDDRGGVGIRLKPAAELVRQYGEQFRREPRRKPRRQTPKHPRL
jgi:hypothetical protein